MARDGVRLIFVDQGPGIPDIDLHCGMVLPPGPAWAWTQRFETAGE